MERVDCVIAGCGPAGAVLGLLLARAGLRVTVAEKHGDFLRDFRGDTIHASTLTHHGQRWASVVRTDGDGLPTSA